MAKLETVTLAGGCFWCTEAIFMRLKGVKKVTSGYTGGKVPNPTYEQVCSGETGHAESIQISFDPKVISFEKLLDVFWKLHDPTTLNRQGSDVGTQYRSEIFFSTEEQQKLAQKSKQEAQKNFSDPIVTQISPASEFYPAEKYHDKYYDNNRNTGYCRLVIDPKIQKLYKEFKSNLA